MDTRVKYDEEDINVLNEDGIKALMVGATLLAGGGGGSYTDGIVLLENFKKANPDKEIKIKVDLISKLSEGKYALVIAGIGAPTEQSDQDFSPCLDSCFDEYTKYICPRTGKSVDFLMPIEMGGFNTLVPILAAIKNDLTIIDADGAGRAVPTLNTTLMNITGIPASPLVLTDANDNRISIIAEHPSSKEMLENISRVVSEEFNANAAIGGWLMDSVALKNVPIGTVMRAYILGSNMMHSLSEHAGEENLGEFVVNDLRNASVSFDLLCSNGKITQFSSNAANGFDIGEYKIVNCENEKEYYRILFKNENLIIYKGNDNEEIVRLTAPDIITMIDRKTGMPLTNEDLMQIYQKGELDELRVCLMLFATNYRWNRFNEEVAAAWKHEFADLGYYGELVRMI